jgi:tetratricopeptide (TPR) repeat protein
MRYRTYAAAVACLLSASLMHGGDTAFDKGEAAMSAKNYAGAIDAFEEALTADPESLKIASEYRLATLKAAVAAHPKEGKPADWDRELAYFDKLTAANPKSANAALNYGFSFVDKIPAAGSISQVIWANKSLEQFTKSINLKPTWIALYTRGNSYLYWPKIFMHTQDAVNDLERAYGMQKAEGKKSYHIRVYISLGDAYWKSDDMKKARAMWQEGLGKYPDSKPLKDRLSKDGDDLKDYIENVLDPSRRVDTDLRELWMSQ